MQVLLLCGKAGSGKNEVARLIAEKKEKTVVTSLAKYIKLFALEMTDWDFTDDTKPRAFLQNMGDTMRAVREDFLTHRLVEDVEIYKQYYDTIVVSDIRLLKEIEYFKKQNSFETVVIKVESSYQKRNLSLKEKEHITETELDTYTTYDYVIRNEFSDKLEKDVEQMLKGMK